MNWQRHMVFYIYSGCLQPCVKNVKQTRAKSDKTLKSDQVHLGDSDSHNWNSAWYTLHYDKLGHCISIGLTLVYNFTLYNHVLTKKHADIIMSSVYLMVNFLLNSKALKDKNFPHPEVK